MKEIDQRERFLMTKNEIIDQIKLNSNVIDIQIILDNLGGNLSSFFFPLNL